MSRTFQAVVLFAAAVGLWQASAAANGSSVPASPGGASAFPSKSPEDLAIEAFKSGFGHANKAKKLEQESAGKTGTEAEKATAKARSEFEKSLKDYQKAAGLNPQLFQA